MIFLNRMKLTALGAVALLSVAIGLSCSQRGGTSDNTGNLKVAFAIPDGDSIGSLTYKITATSGGATLLSGTINTSDPNAAASLDFALPPTASGATDTVVLTATTGKGVACTTAPTTFTVISGANTNVMLSLVCGTGTPTNVPGAVDITTTVSNANSCPIITSAVIGPDQTSFGAGVAVSATAVDPDGDTLSYSWSSLTNPSDNFVAWMAASTTYVCTALGKQSILLTVSDGPCRVDVTLQVTCLATAGTGGATGAAGAGGGPAPSVACATCELNDSVPPLSFCYGTSLGGAATTLSTFGCEGFASATDVAECEALAGCLRGTACQAAIHNATPDYFEGGSSYDDPHPCLCGNIPFEVCLSGTFNGVCAAEYRAAADGYDVNAVYGETILPIGIANNLMTCDVDSTVPANGLQNCGSVCGLNTTTPVGDTTGTGGAASTGGTMGTAGAPATGGTTGAAGTTGAGGATGTGGSTVVASVACDTCEFNDAAPPVSFCVGTAVASTTTTLSAFGCAGFTSEIDRAECEALAACLRGTACQTAIKNATPDYMEAVQGFDDPHPCLCGDIPLVNCIGAASFVGVCAAQYVAAADGRNVSNVYDDNTSPVGVANNLMICDVDSTVVANGLQDCGTVCGLNTATPQ
jgi:hypothetical protein